MIIQVAGEDRDGNSYFDGYAPQNHQIKKQDLLSPAFRLQPPTSDLTPITPLKAPTSDLQPMKFPPGRSVANFTGLQHPTSDLCLPTIVPFDLTSGFRSQTSSFSIFPPHPFIHLPSSNLTPPTSDYYFPLLLTDFQFFIAKKKTRPKIVPSRFNQTSPKDALRPGISIWRPSFNIPT